MNTGRQKGFTIIEVLIVVAILAIISGVIISNFLSQKKHADLQVIIQEIAGALRNAQNKALSSENYSPYGVYFNTSTSPHQYILFKGVTYASRDASADVVYRFPDTFEFSSISLGGGNEVDFSQLTGASGQSGSIAVWMKNDHSQTETVYITTSGAVGFSTQTAATDANRTKDSRHVHFDYNRTIAFNTSVTPCTGETINLYFDGASSPQQTILLCQFISGGVFEWSGTFVVNGENQTIGIKTHHLNDAGYANKNQFSIHRDRRYNTKSVRITISGDTSGNLINYSVDGSATTYSSTYVSAIAWQ